MTPATNEKLDLERLRRQDADEFTRFVHAYQRFVLGMAQSLGLSGADCDDTAAETFAVAYRALPQFRGDSELSTWLYRIGYRTALKVRRRYPSSPAPDANLPDLAAQSPHHASETQETNESIWRAVARLDADQAIAIELFYRRSLTVEEVATIMEKPTGTIKTLLFRGRERLRTLLKPLEKAS